MQKHTNRFKAFSHTVKRVFRSRSIIIISEHKVDHVPLSGVMQVLIIIGFFGFFSGVSYITGSYMSARSVLTEKERKLTSTTIEKGRISEEITALKRDLIRLNQNGNELNSYSKFIISQHSDVLPPQLEGDTVAENNLFGQNTGKLLDRISFLENRVNEVKSENEHLVSAIRERTDHKISYLEDVISMTGLESESLESAAAESGRKQAHHIKSSSSPVKDADLHKNGTNQQGSANEGGPFIPYESALFNSTEQSLLTNVDRLVLLNDIVNKLPLAQPLAESQQMSPFGKRVDPINRRWAMHPGVDLAGPSGSKVHCTNYGTVISAGRKPAYGNMVDIQHEFGIVTRYAHMSRILVHEGDKVSKGQVIGIQGSTGRSTGEHLHYEVRIDDHPVNPVNFLNAGEYVSEE